MREFLVTAMGLAALGTVADVVPLIDENRILVHHGLTSLRQSSLVGIAALLEVTELNQKSYLTSEDVGFTLAPRLNAAGRLGQAAGRRTVDDIVGRSSTAWPNTSTNSTAAARAWTQHPSGGQQSGQGAV